ncbi:MAG TPA: signal peptidase I [Bacilli bacterium]|nr:signal peptidase I [Bacilli bacterium]
MKKSYIKTLCLEFIIMNIIVLNMFIFNIFEANNLNYFFLWLLIDIILFLVIGFEKDKNLYKVDVSQMIFVYSFVYFILVWSIGLILGYTKNPYSLTITNIINNTFILLAIILVQELFRFNIIRKCSQSKIVIFSLNMLLAFISIVINLNNYSFTTALDAFETFGLLIIPNIIESYVLTFMTIKSGYRPAILYRIIFEILLVYIVPITPDLGVYIESILKIIFPTFVFLKLNNTFADDKKVSFRRTSMFRTTLNILSGVTLAFIIVIVSGIFKYQMIAVGSNSMYPLIKKNDAILIEKTEQYDKINIGDILVYKHEREVILHRIVKITKKDNKFIYNTKGDNNNTVDKWDISEKDVIGTVKMVAPYIGYPSVWLSEVIGG